MTDQPHPPGRVRYFELQRLARQQSRDTQELLTLYALEGLLARLAASEHRDQLVLKGGMLLAAFGQRRPTRDLDVHALDLAGDLHPIRQLVADIAAVPIEDGLEFDTAGATAQVIRDDEEYSGVRVALDATLHTARLKTKIDVNFGDPIWPAPQEVTVPRLLDDPPLALRGYPLHMILAEKLVTAIDRGTANTRWRDFADIYLLIRQQPVDAADLDESIRRVAAHRVVGVAPLAEVLAGFPDLSQAKWRAWRAKQDLTDRLPAELADVIADVSTFSDPILERGPTLANASWDPVTKRWTT